MSRKRKRGKLVAIGGLTAVTALLTGFTGARADELADLRANQQLLQQRIDQLAQAQAQAAGPATGGVTGAGTAYGTNAVPGTGMVGGSFPRSFLIPGTDTSIRVGGFADLTIDYYLQNGTAQRHAEHDRREHRQSEHDATKRGIKDGPGLPDRRQSGADTNRHFTRVTGSSSRARVNRVSMSKPARQRLTARRGPLSNSTLPAPMPSAAAAMSARHRCRTAWSLDCAMPMAPWAGSSPVRQIRTLKTPTPTPRVSTLAVPPVKPASSASRRCAIP